MKNILLLMLIGLAAAVGCDSQRPLPAPREAATQANEISVVVIVGTGEPPETKALKEHPGYAVTKSTYLDAFTTLAGPQNRFLVILRKL